MDDRGVPYNKSIFLFFLSLRYLDDFRTALNQASNCIQTLASVSRPGTSPPTSLITSPANGDDLDRVRIDTMAKLIRILQRNLRVRYELNVAELVQS